MWLAVIAIIIFCLFPFYWLVNVSLKTGTDLSESSLFPPSPTLDNYSSVFKNGDFTSALRNSLIVTTVTTVLALIAGSFAAYALARPRSRASSCCWRSSCRYRPSADRDRRADLRS